MQNVDVGTYTEEQYYDDVGANPHIPNAAVFGFRVKVDF